MIKRRFEDIRKGGQNEARPLPSDMCPCCWIDPEQGVPAGAHNKACVWLSYLLSHPWNAMQLGFQENCSPSPPLCLPELNAKLNAKAPWAQQRPTCEVHSADETEEALKNLRKDNAMRRCITQDKLNMLVAAMHSFRLYFPLHHDGQNPRLPDGLSKTVGDGSTKKRTKNQVLHLALHEHYLENAGPLNTTQGKAGWLKTAKEDNDPDWIPSGSVKTDACSSTAAQASRGAMEGDCLCVDFGFKRRSRCGFIKKSGGEPYICIL